MNVSVLIPYRASGPHRARVWTWVRRRWSRIATPDVELIIGSPDPGPFNRAQAINRAAGIASGEVFVIADADVIVSVAGLDWALGVSEGWGFPFDVYYTMTAEWTERRLAESPYDPVPELEFSPAERDVVHRHPGKIAAPCVSGCLVVRAADFRTAGGFDEGFVGWGYEDRAFQETMDRIAGPHWRAPANALHLWHPVPPEHDPNSAAAALNRKRYERLRRSRGVRT